MVRGDSEIENSVLNHRILIKLQNCIFFSFYLTSINKLIPIQTLIYSSSFIKITMPILSFAVFILFKRSILQA